MPQPYPRALHPHSTRTLSEAARPAREFKEIAAILGISIGGTFFIYHRAMNKLRQRHNDIAAMLDLAAELEKNRRAPLWEGEEDA